MFFYINKKLSNQQETKLNSLLLLYKKEFSYLDCLNRNFSNPCLNSILSLIKQLEIINKLDAESYVLKLLSRKKIIYYTDKLTHPSPSHLKKKLNDDRHNQLIFHCYIKRKQIIN